MIGADQYIVYMHTSPSNKRYIGITQQSIHRRWQNGFAYRNNAHFFNAIQLYGWDAFEHQILYENLSEAQAKRKEIDLIAYYKTNNHHYGYNRSTGGESAAGRIFSPQTIQRMRDAHRGKTLSAEQRKKISAANKGRKLSAKHIDVIRKTHTGKFVSEATRQLISERTRKAMTPEVRAKVKAACKGRKASTNTRQKMSQARKNRTWKPQAIVSVCTKTKAVNIFVSSLDAVAWLRMNGYPKASGASLCRGLSGKYRVAYGMNWGRLALEDE